MNQSQFDALVERECSVSISDPDAPLADFGVDSLAHLTLLMAVEEAYGIEIDPEQMTDSALSTAAGLWRYAEATAARGVPC